MKQELPAPTAEGSFEKTPLAHLLVYALERRLSGSFAIAGGDRSAKVLVLQGFPAKITLEPTIPTGDPDPRATIETKLEHVFTFESHSTFAYFDGLDLSEGGQTVAVDPMPVAWRGVRALPTQEHVEATLLRIGELAVKLAPKAQVERFRFTPEELAFVTSLRERPARISDIAARFDEPLGRVLVYFLVITKQVDLVEAATSAPAPAFDIDGDLGEAIPIPPPDPAEEVETAAPPSSSKTIGGQAFARVQLQAKPVPRAPLVIEEMPPSSTASDPRRTPPPSPIRGERPSEEAAFAGMMQQAIVASLPPPAPATRAIAPPPVAAPAKAEPAKPVLSPEQQAARAKIVQRASAIMSEDYFQMLGVARDAGAEQIQKAFIGLAKIWHPDRLPPALGDVKNECSKVFTHLTEANATLIEPKRRAAYMQLLKDGGATPDEQEKIQVILEAATEFQKAEILMKRNVQDPQVLELVRKAVGMDPEQSDYLALLAWLESQRPDGQAKDKTLEKIQILDGCLAKNEKSERAHFYRGMLYKRIDNTAAAIKDFKRAAELNPRNLDAVREVRLFHMRGGANSKAPPSRASAPPPEVKENKVGALFGKLFKK